MFSEVPVKADQMIQHGAVDRAVEFHARKTIPCPAHRPGRASRPSGSMTRSTLTNPSGMSTTTNYFKAGLETGSLVNATAAVALNTGWARGAYDPATFGGGQVGRSNTWAAVTLALRPA